MMKLMEAFYDLLKDFQDDDDYYNAMSMDTVIDLWDAFNKPTNPRVSVPKLRDALSRNAAIDPEGSHAYEMSAMLLNEHYPDF